MVSKMAAKTMKIYFCPHFSFFDTVNTFEEPKNVMSVSFCIKMMLLQTIQHK